MKPIFFFGSLRDLELLAIVLGREIGPDETRPALAHDHATVFAAGQSYPILVPDAGNVAEGLLFQPATPVDLARLAYYEEAEYDLVQLEVTADGTTVAADHFCATTKIVPSTTPWRIEDWSGVERLVALEAAREVMPHWRSVPVEQIDTIWPGIMNRARQRVRGAGTPVPASPISSRYRTDDVRWEAIDRPFTGYMCVESHRLSHRRFDGGWTAPLTREAAVWGDAVTVLPWDPRSDRVLLIEQFRLPVAARHDPAPWLVEVVAGRIDAPETDEETARREAQEEAGIRLGRMERLPDYYASPGLASEFLSAFIAEADLRDVGDGSFGNRAENEDIRRMVLPLDTALDALRTGAIRSGPAQILLLWLALRREELRAAWSVPAAGPANAAGA